MPRVQQFLKTHTVKQMPTIGNVTWYATRVNVFQTYGTIGMWDIFYALVNKIHLTFKYRGYIQYFDHASCQSCVIVSLPYACFVTGLASTCCTWHSERICHDHQLYIFHIRRNGIGSYPHRQKDCTPGMCIYQIDNGNSDKWPEQVDECHTERISILWLLSYSLCVLPARRDKTDKCTPCCSMESMRKKTKKKLDMATRIIHKGPVALRET